MRTIEDGKVVALASSAGGIAALSRVLGGLPPDLAAPVLVVQHLDPHHQSTLADILERRSPFVVVEAAEGLTIQPGHVYVAPPDHHLLVTAGGVLELTKGELVHFVRPSADLLFESLAAAFGPRAIGVVLSGTGLDGALGVVAIKDRGGFVIVQEAAEFDGMPVAAIATGSVDVVAPLDEIAARIVDAAAAVRS